MRKMKGEKKGINALKLKHIIPVLRQAQNFSLMYYSCHFFKIFNEIEIGKSFLPLVKGGDRIRVAESEFLIQE